MQPLDRDEVSLLIQAPPERIYALVADVTRMPQFSPEITRCVWLDDATGPAVGARFEASNALGRGRPWKNQPVITVADPGREFAFCRTERLAGTIVWRYRFQPDAAGGTRVIESYEVTKPISRLGWLIIERLYGSRDRRADLRAGMHQTLARIRDVAESRSRLPAVADEHAPAPTGEEARS